MLDSGSHNPYVNKDWYIIEDHAKKADHDGVLCRVVDAIAIVKSPSVTHEKLLVAWVNHAFYDPHGETLIPPPLMEWAGHTVDTKPITYGGSQTIELTSGLKIPLYFNGQDLIFYVTKITQPDFDKLPRCELTNQQPF